MLDGGADLRDRGYLTHPATESFQSCAHKGDTVEIPKKGSSVNEDKSDPHSALTETETMRPVQ